MVLVAGIQVICYFIRPRTAEGSACSDVVCEHDLISLSGQAQVELHPHQCHLWPPVLRSCLSQRPIPFHLMKDG